MASEATDRELLELYSGQASEEAFRVLLRRHMPMVYSVCVRTLGDKHLAEDAAQASFVILARKARRLKERDVLADWLYRTAQYVACDLRRRVARTRRHEESAAVEAARARVTSQAPGCPDFDSSGLRAVLGEAMVTLPAISRRALVLHYLEGRSREDAAQLLGCTPDALRMRLNYGLEKLRARLTRRGVAVSAALLAGWLADGSAEVLPPSVIAGAEAAVLGGTAASAAHPAIGVALHALRSMFWARVRLGALSTALALCSAVAVSWLAVGGPVRAAPSVPASPSPAPVAAATIAAPASFPTGLSPAQPQDGSAAAPADDVTAQVTQGALRFRNAAGRYVECPLQHTEVRAAISGFVTRVQLTQTFRNPTKEVIEATYVFPLPHEAAVGGMTMVVGQRRIVGVIKKREEAREVYARALAEGKTAALLEQERPNVFVQSVGNIEPGQTVRIEISYVDILAYDMGTYIFHFPMVVGPRYNPAGGGDGIGAVPAGAAGTSGQGTEVQYLKPGERNGHDVALALELDAGVPIRDLKPVNHRVDLKQTGPGTATCRILPSDSIPNKNFELRYRVAGQKPEVAVLAHAPSGGDGYFMLMVQPGEDQADAKVPPREVVFLVDVSGSMSGGPSAKVKQAMKLFLERSSPADRIQVVAFASQASKLFPGPVACSEENVRKALAFADSCRAGGGTEMLEGIRLALGEPPDPARVRIVILLTDGFIGNEAEIIREVGARCGDRLRFWCIGIGTSVNRFLVDGVAKQGGGMGRVLSLNSAPGQVKDLVDEVVMRIHRPQIANLAIDWGTLNVSETHPARIPELWAGRPAVVFGRYSGGDRTGIRLTGEAEGRPVDLRIAVDLPKKEAGNDALAVAWARRKIESLTDRMTVEGECPELVAQVTSVALAYRLMTRYTSFVAVDEEKLKSAGVDPAVPRSLGVPVPLPEGVEYATTVAPTGTPAPAPTPAATPAEGAGVAQGGKNWGWWEECYSISWCALAVLTLGVAMLIVFLCGLRRGHCVRTPLWLGLFAFGFGLLGTVTSLIDCFSKIASMGGSGGLADMAEGCSWALVNALEGIVVAMVGGLLTWILHARAKHLERLAAEAEEIEEESAG